MWNQQAEIGGFKKKPSNSGVEASISPFLGERIGFHCPESDATTFSNLKGVELMAEEIKCSRCKHKLPKNICGSSKSPYYNQQIGPSGSCDSFLENPAQDHFTEGLIKSMKDTTGDIIEAVRQLETAIELGLPHDDEMEARFILGGIYKNLVDSELSMEEMITTKEFSELIRQMEKAVLIDAECGYGYFSEALNRARLPSLDSSYSLVAHSIREKEGNDAAIAYLKQKLGLFDYLSSNPMLTMLLNLAVIYAELDMKEQAGECWKKILEAEPVDLDDGEGSEAETRKMAEDNLKALESKNEKGSKCFIATAVYGTPYAPEVQSLRKFRDEFLLPKFLGRLLVRSYYRISPVFASHIARSKLTQLFTKLVILKPILWFIVGYRYVPDQRNRER